MSSHSSRINCLSVIRPGIPTGHSVFFCRPHRTKMKWSKPSRQIDSLASSFPTPPTAAFVRGSSFEASTAASSQCSLCRWAKVKPSRRSSLFCETFCDSSLSKQSCPSCSPSKRGSCNFRSRVFGMEDSGLQPLTRPEMMPAGSCFELVRCPLRAYRVRIRVPLQGLAYTGAVLFWATVPS